MTQTATPVSDLSSFLGTQPGVERIYDNVQTMLPGVSVPGIKMALWNTIEEFAQRTLVLRRDFDWTMGPGTVEITFNPIDADTLTCAIVGVTGINNYRIDDPATLVDRGNTAVTRIGTVTVATKPSGFEANMPEVLFGKWFETMLDGTLYRLYGQPAKPWSSTGLGAYHARRYRSGLVQARAAGLNRFGEQNTWRFPPFASGRRR